MGNALHSKVCSNCKKVFISDNDYLVGTSHWAIDSHESLYFNCQCGTTLMLPKGKYAWHNPTLNMSADAQGLVNLYFKDKLFPRIPSVMFELKQLLESEHLSSLDLAKCALKDPFFSARLIQLATLRTNDKDNEKIKSLEHAISILGRKTVSSLVSLVIFHYLTIKTKCFTERILWSEIFTFGHLCIKINSLYKKPKFSMTDDEAFLLGALASPVGKLVGAAYFPEKTDEIYMRTMLPGQNITWREAEVELKAYPHTILGEIAGVLWGFPSYILFHIRTYIDDRREAFYFEDFIRNNILRFATNLGMNMLGSTAIEYVKNYEIAAANLGFSADKIEIIKEEMRSEVERIQQEMEPFLTP